MDTVDIVDIVDIVNIVDIVDTAWPAVWGQMEDKVLENKIA